jgi:predicted nucleic acid-binding Zn ribbon protein
MCRNMDINYYHKQHDKIKEQFRHDIIMSKIKQREDKLFINMFIKISLIITAIVLLVTVVF